MARIILLLVAALLLGGCGGAMQKRHAPVSHHHQTQPPADYRPTHTKPNREEHSKRGGQVDLEAFRNMLGDSYRSLRPRSTADRRDVGRQDHRYQRRHDNRRDRYRKKRPSDYGRDKRAGRDIVTIKQRLKSRPPREYRQAWRDQIRRYNKKQRERNEAFKEYGNMDPRGEWYRRKYGD